MSRPPIDLTRRIKDILQHTTPLPAEASAPLSHYRRTGTDIWNSLAYVERNFSQLNLYQAVATRHLGRLYVMALVNLVETFERFLKELAAECVECLANFILDDRFNAFKIQGSSLASHFGTATLGKSLCESATWLDSEEINERFRKLLADPFQVGGQFFYLFPKPNQQPVSEVWRFEPMSLVWQLRHTAVHNVGVITQSDAVKLRLLAKEAVEAPRVLSPTRDDLRYIKRFLDGTAESCNQRVGQRLAELLTLIHIQAPVLFPSAEMANRVSQIFGFSLTVAAVPGVVPPP
jgi:hypothetical protein